MRVLFVNPDVRGLYMLPPVVAVAATGMLASIGIAALRADSGFEEAYFLYYEDVEIYRRLNVARWRATIEEGVEVRCDTDHGSRRNTRFGPHHLGSALRFLSRPRRSAIGL